LRDECGTGRYPFGPWLSALDSAINIAEDGDGVGLGAGVTGSVRAIVDGGDADE